MLAHIYNRGVDRRTIFAKTEDYQRFHKGMIVFNDSETEGKALISRIPFPEPAEKPLVHVIAYCLMPNHVHFLIEDVEEEGIRRFFSRLFDGYTKYFNAQQQRTGRLFETSFKSRSIQHESDLLNLTRYIHRNPLDLIGAMPDRSEPILETPTHFLTDYPWSSLRTFSEGKHDKAVNHGCLTDIFTAREYTEFLHGKTHAPAIDDLKGRRKQTVEKA